MRDRFASCVFALLALVAAFHIGACGSGGGGGSGAVGVQSASGMVQAATGGVVGSQSGAHVDIPAGALSADTMISISADAQSALGEGMIGAGPTVRASPDGLSFSRPATIAVPVDPNMIPDGVALEDLSVYRRQSNGSVSSVPVVGYDDRRMLLYATTRGFSSFQAAVPDGEFQIIPRTSILADLNSVVLLTLETTRGQDMIQWQVVDAMKVEGVGENDAEIPEGFVAPGVYLRPDGTIYGAANELGVFAFTIQADSLSPSQPASSTISLTLTIAEREETGFAEAATEDLLQFQYDDQGNLLALGRKNQVATLIKVPADPMMPVITRPVNLGLNPHLGVSPDGQAVVLVYEKYQNLSLEFGLSTLRTAFNDRGDGVVDNVSFDLIGDGTPDVTVSFETDEDQPYSASPTELARLADELNEAFRMLDLRVRARANGTFEGLAILDNQSLFLASQSGIPYPVLLTGGDAVTRTPNINTSYSPLDRRVVAQEFDRMLNPLGQEVRIDQDITYDPVNDPRLTAFSRQAINPRVAFAQDYGVEPETDEDGNPVPIRRVYAVVYEQIRHLGLEGELRSDVYMRWREFRGLTLSDETRLDTTDLAGQSAGDAIAIAGTEAGVTIAWTDLGGDNGGTNGRDSLGNLILGSPGDVLMVLIDKPDLPPLPGPDDDPEDVEPLEVPYEVTVPTPTEVNDPAATTGRFPTFDVSRANEIYMAWSERDDALAPLLPSPQTGGLSAQTSRIVDRRELALRVAPVNGGGIGGSFLVKDAPLESSIYEASIAVSEDGEVAVAWVEAFFNGQQGTFMRRFRNGGTPLENSVEISIGYAALLEYDERGRLNLGFLTGGTINTYRFGEDPPPEDDDEEDDA